jgi:collagenase-like PrtC family protease
MVKFSIPANWQYDLIPLLPIGHIDELYGTLADDFLGGGRPSFMLTSITKKHFTRYLWELRNRGIGFNYLLNATCIGNREFTRQGQKQLRSLLDWLVGNKVGAITVSLPYLLEFAKKKYPFLRVYISTMAGVDSLQRAKYWESLGADRITLSAVSNASRNFALLRHIRNNIKCELQLIANLTCLRECPLSTYHSTMYSHASQPHHHSRGFLIDYCFLKCNYIKLKDPAEFIRSGWIRPEDLHYYEEIGFNRIKFANRDMSTENILKLLIAYSNRYYEGDLLSLFSDRSKQIYAKKYSNYPLKKLKYFFKPFSVNIFKFLELRELLDNSGLYVDNRALDGFLEFFIRGNCSPQSCENCNYCRDVASMAVKIDANKRQDLLDKYYYCLDNLNSGKMFTYFDKKEF